MRKYGQYHKLYLMWYHMIKRCVNPDHPAYKNYGGRGISVCSEWIESREAFTRFALNNGWRAGLHIDRINNNGNYEPNNVRFVTAQTNQRNRRSNTHISIGGKTMTLAEWAEQSGVGRATIGNRLHRGVTGENLIIPPKQNTLADLARKIGIRADTLKWRMKKGYPIDAPLYSLRGRC